MKNTKIYKKWWFWVIIILFLLILSNLNKDNSKNENQIHTNNDSIIFLPESNGLELFNSLCNIANIEPSEGLDTGDSIIYTASSDLYGIEIETNKNNEINWISIYTFTDNYNEFFLKIADLKYSTSNREDCYNWISDNLGKKATTKIGDANFEMSYGKSGKPILNVYIDGNEQFQQEQLDKITK